MGTRREGPNVVLASLALIVPRPHASARPLLPILDCPGFCSPHGMNRRRKRPLAMLSATWFDTDSCRRLCRAGNNGGISPLGTPSTSLVSLRRRAQLQRPATNHNGSGFIRPWTTESVSRPGPVLRTPSSLPHHPSRIELGSQTTRWQLLGTVRYRESRHLNRILEVGKGRQAVAAPGPRISRLRPWRDQDSAVLGVPDGQVQATSNAVLRPRIRRRLVLPRARPVSFLDGRPRAGVRAVLGLWAAHGLSSYRGRLCR